MWLAACMARLFSVRKTPVQSASAIKTSPKTVKKKFQRILDTNHSVYFRLNAIDGYLLFFII